MLTGVEEDVERIVSLEIGADYYLTKPFNPRVLIAHIHALLRRSNNTAAAVVTNVDYDVYEFVGWKLNITTRTLISANNKLVKMTSAEFMLLQAFMMHPQRVLTRDQLLELTNTDSSAFDRSIDIMVSRLRRKIEKAYTHVKIFTTVRSSGYLLSCKVSLIKMSSAQWDELLRLANT
jgi:two-component system OmpR family response regulator